MSRNTIDAAVVHYEGELRRALRTFDAAMLGSREYDSAAMELGTAATRYLHALDNRNERRQILSDLRHTKQGDVFQSTA